MTPADLPILGWAQITVKVSNLDKSRHFYSNILGFPEVFDLYDRAGNVTSAYFKVNDDQFIELVPGLKSDDIVRESRIVVQSSDLEKLRAAYVQRGVNPGPISKGADGNLIFRTVTPRGVGVDFIQYLPDSKQSKVRGRMLSTERVSKQILHFGAMVRDDQDSAFWQRLGFNSMLPGKRGEYVEPMAVDQNRETKNPPLDPANPNTARQYEREVFGAVYHIALIVDDSYVARETLRLRGGYDDVRVRTALGNNRRWLTHVFDPDGTRVEVMSRDLIPSDIPSYSVLPPGPPAPPILATEPRVYPWP